MGKKITKALAWLASHGVTIDASSKDYHDMVMSISPRLFEELTSEQLGKVFYAVWFSRVHN